MHIDDDRLRRDPRRLTRTKSQPLKGEREVNHGRITPRRSRLNLSSPEKPPGEFSETHMMQGGGYKVV